MGLADQIRAGANLDRIKLTIQTDAIGSGSASLGATFCILDIQTNTACRLRLYDDSASLENSGEKIRSFGNTSVSASVGLIGDFSMSAPGVYSIDPIVYGVTYDATTPYTYYRIENADTPPVIQITRYLLEDINTPLVIGGSYDLANRRTLPAIQTSILAANATASGTLSNINIPQTYLLVSASLSGSNNIARLRLYSFASSINNATEKARPFSTEPSTSIGLIADVIISGSETVRFAPKIIGANLENMGSDLIFTKADRTKMVGDAQRSLHYIIENKGTVSRNMTASLYVYSLED